MVFSSALFLFLFLPVTLVGNFIAGVKLRNLFLLIMSLLFYAWGKPVYVFLMLFSIMLNYTAGLLIHLHRNGKIAWLGERGVVVAAISLNLLLLIYFKYAEFLISNINCVLKYFHFSVIRNPNVSLPIGISFFTFQAMSYVIDVYRKETDAQLNPLNSALYVAFFPQVMAGPIVRYHDVARQIVSRTISRHDFSCGVQRFVFGLSKKVLLANPLGEVADKIFSVSIQDVTPGTAWLGAACYTLQIFYDFSGYSDMAIGLGKMFGFNFPENFNYPYVSQSIKEFWRRWHISLSTWFRDYLYIPLGGGRTSKARTCLNLWIVFFLCGLWHGASWNFVAWGMLHGSCLVMERWGGERHLAKMWRPLRHAYAMGIVIIGWVFFRSETLKQATQYLASMFGFTNADGSVYYAAFYFDPKTVLALIGGCLLAIPVPVSIKQQMQFLVGDFRMKQGGSFLLDLGGYGIWVALLMLSVACLAAGTYNSFIYYRF